MSAAANHGRAGLDYGEAWEESYKYALTTSEQGQAEYLLATIGPRIAAAALGISDARQLKAWASGSSTPRSADVQGRLALLFRMTYVVTQTYSGSVAALFLRSANPQLDDEVPLMVLRESDPDVVQSRLLAATRAFVEV